MDFLYSDDSQDSYKSSSSSHSEHVLFRDNYILNEKTNKKKNILQLLYSREVKKFGYFFFFIFYFIKLIIYLILKSLIILLYS